MLRVALVTVGDPARLTGGYLYQGRVAERAADHDATVDVVHPAAVLGWSRRSRRWDVVLLDSLAAARLALAPVGPPLVALLHQPPGGAPPNRWRAALDRRTYRRACLLVVVSDLLARQVADLGRVVVVPPGRDPAGAGPAASTAPGAIAAASGVEPPLNSDPEHLRRGRHIGAVCVANWLPHKGILPLLDAVARLPGDALTLHLVGDPDADTGYAAQVKARLAGLTDRVVVHGSLPPARVAALLAAADVFALPSRGETYGMAHAEALAAGLPVIGWHSGNLPFLVHDGVEGILLPEGDVAGLAAALGGFAADPAQRSRLAANARRRGAELPTWDETASLLYAELRGVADDVRSGPR